LKDKGRRAEGRKKLEARGRRSEDRRQKMEGGGAALRASRVEAKIKGQMTDDRGRRTEGRKKSEVRGQRSEVGDQKTEDVGKREDVGGWRSGPAGLSKGDLRFALINCG